MAFAADRGGGTQPTAQEEEILTLRTDNSHSDVILIEGVDSGHRATDVLTARI